MLISVFPLLLAIAGALLYGLSSNGKVQELGRIAYACGLLALAFHLATVTLRLG